MELIKKHYEKIILMVVLLGLAATAVLLFMEIEKRKAELDIQVSPPAKVRGVDSVDVEQYRNSVEKQKNAQPIDLSTPHHVFNPLVWKQTADGRLVKIVTRDLPEIVDVRPLYLVISYVRGTETGYYFEVERQGAKRSQDRKKVQRYLSVGGKTDLFVLKKIEGTPANPTAFILELADTKAEVAVTPSMPFKRMDGYAADLRYTLENRMFNNVRAGDPLMFAGEQYKVVAITENEVTVQANSNQKQVTIKKNAP